MKKQLMALGLVGVMMFGMATSVMADTGNSVTCDVTIDTRALALETKVVNGAGITGPVTTFEDVVVTDLNNNGSIDMLDALIAASDNQTNFTYTIVDSTYGDYLTVIGNQGPDVTDPSYLLTAWGYVQSGWMGSVNGVYPSTSLSLQSIASGDDVDFRFTITGSYDIATGNYIPGPNNDYPSLDLEFIDLVDEARASSDSDIKEIGDAYYATIAAYADTDGYTSKFFQEMPLVDEIDGLRTLLQ